MKKTRERPELTSKKQRERERAYSSISGPPTSSNTNTIREIVQIKTRAVPIYYMGKH